MHPTLIEHYLAAARPLLERYGYFGIFGAVFVEGFGLPAPGQTMIIAGSALAATGNLRIGVVLVVSWAAAVVGDNVGYAIGHFGGRRVILRYGRRVGIREDRLARVERFFDARGAWIVGVARFFDVLRQLNGVVAGSSGMRWWTFLVFNALGAVLWVGIWGYGTYRLGRHIEVVLAFFGRIEPVAIAIGVVALLGLVAYLVFRHRSRKRDEGPPDDETP